MEGMIYAVSSNALHIMDKHLLFINWASIFTKKYHN